MEEHASSVEPDCGLGVSGFAVDCSTKRFAWQASLAVEVEPVCARLAVRALPGCAQLGSGP